jgi:hypothetical protein
VEVVVGKEDGEELMGVEKKFCSQFKILFRKEKGKNKR